MRVRMRKRECVCGNRTSTYVVATLGLPELDVFGCDCLDGARGIDNAGPSRAGSYIDADIMVLRLALV